jgi:hypothetical protein
MTGHLPPGGSGGVNVLRRPLTQFLNCPACDREMRTDTPRPVRRPNSYSPHRVSQSFSFQNHRSPVRQTARYRRRHALLPPPLGQTDGGRRGGDADPRAGREQGEQEGCGGGQAAGEGEVVAFAVCGRAHRRDPAGGVREVQHRSPHGCALAPDTMATPARSSTLSKSWSAFAYAQRSLPYLTACALIPI